ncbi:MAG: hypothetical protein Q8S84_04625 [bacterium]|nr:hypothetical protein [bacterium]
MQKGENVNNLIKYKMLNEKEIDIMRKNAKIHKQVFKEILKISKA